MSILNEITETKREHIASRRSAEPLDAIRARASAVATRNPISTALRSSPFGLIAECKRKSPSAGTIRDPFDPVEIAETYVRAGAQAVSVLVDEPYFGGGEADLCSVTGAIDRPVLYKEFVVDPWQAWHARACGASDVLLIVAALDPGELKDLFDEVRRAGLEALVEVFDEQELALALDVGAEFIGINNRNLKTFEVDLGTSLRVAAAAPDGITLIGESGIRTADDVKHLADAGLHGILVGEQLLRQADAGAAVQALMEQVWEPS